MSQKELPPPVLRHMPEYADQVFRDMYSTKRRRDSVMSILADAVVAADSLSPASWGITLNSNRLCFNVGRGASLQLYPDYIFFVVTRSMLEQVDSKAMRVFEDNQSYKYIPDNAEGIIPIGQLKHYSAFRKAHFDAIERSTQDRSKCFWPDAHSPGVIDLLIERGFDLTQPAYIDELEIENLSSRPDSVWEAEVQDIVGVEGKAKLVTHLRRERNSKLVREKKKKVLKETGCLKCEVCSFDFRLFYGELGEGFAEAHHDVPLSASDQERTTSLDDLKIVCSNCHRMLHSNVEVLSIAALKQHIKMAKRKTPSSSR
jgi:predicted HNH restriction endonuclease